MCMSMCVCVRGASGVRGTFPREQVPEELAHVRVVWLVVEAQGAAVLEVRHELQGEAFAEHLAAPQQPSAGDQTPRNGTTDGRPCAGPANRGSSQRTLRCAALSETLQPCSDFNAPTAAAHGAEAVRVLAHGFTDVQRALAGHPAHVYSIGASAPLIGAQKAQENTQTLQLHI